MRPANLAGALSSPLNAPCLWPVTFMLMVTPTAALAGFAPALGLAICHATPVKSAAARATASAIRTVRLRETTDDRVMLPSLRTAPAAGRPAVIVSRAAPLLGCVAPDSFSSGEEDRTIPSGAVRNQPMGAASQAPEGRPPTACCRSSPEAPPDRLRRPGRSRTP